ncbi:hypothetical protein DPMN_134751 [Dreissena polymorpha]|uniref:Uncharacterized protein n=1 Tax=Dreissena polymorpha TaxID=45954 RepID=A0A9D4G0N7_DREPO|nr:hypothetical protein DPMN_134751 [Dreissena polymorpha]
MADIIDANHRRPRQFRRVNRQLTDFDDDEIRRRYRFLTASIDKLENMIDYNRLLDATNSLHRGNRY